MHRRTDLPPRTLPQVKLVQPQASGLVREDGSKASFARAEANKRYLDMEEFFTGIVIVAGGIYILDEMIEESNR